MAKAVANPTLRLGVCSSCGRYGQISRDNRLCADIEVTDKVGTVGLASKRVAACQRRSSRSRTDGAEPVATEREVPVAPPVPESIDTDARGTTQAPAERGAESPQIEGS